MAKLQKASAVGGGLPPPVPSAPPEDQPPGTVAPTVETPEQPTTAPPSEKPGLMSRLVDGAKSLLANPGETAAKAGSAYLGMLAGGARSPEQALGATVDAGVSLGGNVVGDQVRFFGDALNAAPEVFPGQKSIAATALAWGNGLDRAHTNLAGFIRANDYLSTVGNSSVNDAMANIGSLVIGAAGSDEARLFAYAPKLLKGGLDFAAASGVLQDPNSARLSSALKGLGVDTEFTNWLGADPHDAPEWENRVKNVIENTLVGGAADMTFQGLKYFRSVLKGAPDVAAKEAATVAAKEVIPEEVRPGETTVEAVPSGDTTEIKVNGETATTVPTNAYDGLLKDAKDSTDTGGSGPRDQPSDSVPGQGELGGSPKGSLGDASLPGLGTPDSVAPLLRSLAIQLHDTPHIVRPDADLMASAASAARDVGVSPEDMLAYAQHVAGNVAGIDTAATVTRTLWRKIAGDVDQFAARGFDSIGEADLPTLKGAIHNAISFTGSFQTIRSSLGRGLRSLGLPDAEAYMAGTKGDEALTNALHQDRPTPPLPESPQEIKDWLEMWNSTTGDPEGRQNFLRAIQTLPSQFKYLRTSFANMFTANALAGVPSLSMNAVGPAIIGVLHTLEKTSGAFVKSLDPSISAVQRSQLQAVATNAARAYVQTIGDIPDAFRYALQAARSNRSILGGGWTVDVGRMGPITDGMLRASRMADGFTGGYQLGNLINFWPRNFQRINSGLDEFAKRLSYMGETRLNALVEASSGYSLDGKPLFGGNGGPPMDAAMRADYVRSAMENSIDEVGQATNETTLRTAERTTFTGSLSDNAYHPLVNKAASFVQAMRSQFPESRYILPVFNVPANSVGETMRRIPGVNLLLGETRDELLGNLGPVRQADAYGRTMLGAAALMWGYHMARQGDLTGPGPSDPTAMKAWGATHQPYSVRVGDKWVNYSRYDLPGALLGIPGALYDHTVYRPQDQDFEAHFVGGIGAMAQYFKDKAALQGMSDLMNFSSNPNAGEAYFTTLAGNMATRMVVPNFVTQLGRNVQDPTKRTMVTVGDHLMNALPWASQTLDPVRNVLGEDLYTPRDSILENLAPLTIAPVTTNKSDPVMAELDRLYQATGSAAGVSHHTEFDGGYYDSRSVKLEDGHSLYDHLISARQTIKPDGGVPLRQALQDLFASDEYKQASDADASNLVASDGSFSRGAVVSRTFSAYNQAAVQDVAAQSPIAKRWLAVTLAKKTDDARLRAYPADQLAGNNDLMKALGIDITQYEQKVSGQ